MGIIRLLRKINLDKIEDYTLKEVLGGGKASLTLLYENNNEKIVIKMLIAPRNEFELTYFQNEAEAFKSLQHYNGLCFVPKLKIEFQQVPNYPIYYFAIEYIDGESLSSRIEKMPPPWHWRQAIELLHRIAVALGGCNIQYVHRDIHPGNILLVENAIEFNPHDFYVDPGVRILDFGCAKNQARYMYYGTLNEDKFRHIGALTSWSPEFIFNPEAVDSKQDSWALGVLLFFLLTNTYPIPANNFGEYLKNIMDNNLDVHKLNQGIPLSVKKLVMNLLSFEPQLRFGCGEIASTCAAILYTNLNELDEVLINEFFTGRGGLYLCYHCNGFVGRAEARCKHCGKVLGPEDTLPFLKKLL